MSEQDDIAAMRVDDNLWILDSAARQVMRRFPSAEYDELISHGYIALRKASESFDPTRGISFGSFAWIRAAGAMMDALRKDLTIDRRMIGAAFEAITLMNDPGDVMRDDQAKHCLTAEEYLSAIAAAASVSVLSRHSARHTVGDTDAELGLARAVKSLVVALERISPEDAHLIELHYMQSSTLRSIAEQLEINYQKVKRRHSAALRELAHALRHASG